MVLLTWLSIVSMVLGLIGIYVLNILEIKKIIRDIAYHVKYFVKTHDLTNDAIKNITWKEHDRLFWLVTIVWLLSMFLGAIFTMIMFMNFG